MDAIMIKKVDDIVLEGLWDEYQIRPTVELRNEIAMHYEDLARIIALKMSPQYSKTNYTGVLFGIDDLYNIAFISLLHCVERYDPTKGVLFNTYAPRRMKGRIMDCYRLADFRKRTGLAKKLPRVYFGPASQFTDANSTSESSDAGNDILDITMTPPRPFQHLDNVFLKECLNYLCHGLPRNQRLAIELWYCTDLNMREVGDAVGVTESRISQMIKDTNEMVKERATEWKDYYYAGDE